ncbi:MAG: 30S ribosomal protein S17 [archaeon]|nr:30S ribosomal protein S17 [archaeon]
MITRTKNIGIDVNPPETTCSDPNCPFHGNLSVRGQIIDGKVVSVRMNKTAMIERNYLKYEKKYERYEKRTSRYAAHAPVCLNLKIGDEVRIMECRPLGKTVSFVVIEKREIE